jgi:predicted glycosyltransferase
MHVLVTIQHGENVHLFKHAIEELREDGHEVSVFAREKDINLDLLDAYDIEHTVLCGAPDGLFDLAAVQLRYEWSLLRAARALDPDVVLTSHGVAGPHVATLLGARSVTFLDTEAHVAAQHKLFVPFSDELHTPASLQSTFGETQRRYPGLHELAYLHPDRFEPDPSVLTSRGVDPDDRFFVVRLNAWDAHHDVGKGGFSPEEVDTLLETLSAHGTVFVSEERTAERDRSVHRLPVEPHEIHHLMAFADLFVGDVTTMTVEAAVLGTPTVRVSPFATERDMGKFRLLEDEYGLCYSFHTTQFTQALAVAESLASDPGADDAFATRRAELLADTVDVTDYIVDQVTAQAQRADDPASIPTRLLAAVGERLGGTPS